VASFFLAVPYSRRGCDHELVSNKVGGAFTIDLGGGGGGGAPGNIASVENIFLIVAGSRR